MRRSEIIERIKDLCPYYKGNVKGAGDLVEAEKKTQLAPAAFVIPWAERSQPNKRINGFDQKKLYFFAVLSVVRNVSDAVGDNASDDLEIAREQLHEALCGWTPESAFMGSPCEHADSKNLPMQNLTLLYIDIFSIEFHYRKT